MRIECLTAVGMIRSVTGTTISGTRNMLWEETDLVGRFKADFGRSTRLLRGAIVNRTKKCW